MKTFSHKKIKNTIYVKSNTPYVSALKRVNKFLERLQKTGGSTHISLLGMGKAIEKTLSIGCHFQTAKGRKVDILTTSVDVIDELEEMEQEEEDILDEDKETVLKKRTISGVEVRIYL